jgi:hypothetical protein
MVLVALETDDPNEEETEEYYVYPLRSPSAPVVNNSDEHNDMGFCVDPTCPDKEDQDLINNLHQAVQDGEITVEEADLIYNGRTV